MNLVVLSGNLTRDVDVRHTGGGVAVCNGAIALNRRFKKGEEWVDEATFVEFAIWGARGEAFAKYHRKGSRASMTGRLTLDQWADKTTGEKKSRLKVTVEEWEFADSKSESNAPTSSPVADAVEETPF
jgi:single-strand DNA-binding protein